MGGVRSGTKPHTLTRREDADVKSEQDDFIGSGDRFHFDSEHFW